MDIFYTVVVVVAVIMLILVLTYVGLMIAERNVGTSLVEYPPIANSCPDNWIAKTLTDNDGNESIYCEVPSINMKNKGTILEPSTTNSNMTNAQITYGYNETLFTDVSSNPVGVIDFNDPLWLSTGKTSVCAKKDWCDTFDIIWDGVTNYSKCN